MTRYEIGAAIFVASVVVSIGLTAYNEFEVKRTARENNKKLDECADILNRLAREERPITNSDVEEFKKCMSGTTRLTDESGRIL